MNKQAIKELYWFTEDLQAYTDLTGNHFDIEKAQSKLWKMNPILTHNDLPEIQNLYDELLDALEIPSFFDKAAFAEMVEALSELLESMQENL
jgi:hypothetical protein